MIKKANRLNQVKEYYFSTKLQEIRMLIADGKPIINLGIGSPDLAPPKTVIKAIINAVQDDTKHSYRSYQGLPEFRQAIANFYQRHYEVKLNSKNEILPLMGSKEGIMHISMAFLNEGDKVLIPNPGYITYSSVAKMIGAKPILYNLTQENNWYPNLAELEKQDLSKVKIMWLNYPNMPTGAIATKELFKKLIAFAKKHKILLINDNPYSFVLNQEPLSILAIEGAKEVALELNSLSKTFNMAGWRVGMVVGKSDYIKAILQIKSNMDSGMFYGIQKGAIAALEITNGWFDNLNNIYKKRREIVWRILDILQCEYDKKSVGLFVWAKIPKGMNSEELTNKLLYENDIFFTPGTIFGTNGENYIRVSLCIPEEQLLTVETRCFVSKQ
jgi:aspartate/methionine/tyrosine aminotransferase